MITLALIALIALIVAELCDQAAEFGRAYDDARRSLVAARAPRPRRAR